MTLVALIRPGCTDFDDQGRIQGTLDLPINPVGQQEVKGLVPVLQPFDLEYIYSSPCQSAYESAKVLGAGLKLKVKKLEAFRNLDHGLWQGMPIDEIKRKHPSVFRQAQEHPEMVCPPQGEVVEDALSRVQEAVQKILRKHRDGKIALVVPEPLATVVRSTLTKTPLTDLWADLGTTGIWERIDVVDNVPANA